MGEYRDGKSRQRGRIRRDGIRVPLESRLPIGLDRRAEINAAHEAALDSSSPVYRDPITGASVFTSVFLAQRGYCCDSGCRHCPYAAQ